MLSALRLVALPVVAVALCGVAMAQSVSPTPQMKQLGQWGGKWVYQEEFRAKPDATWEKGSSDGEFRWLPGGFFVETPGTINMPDGQRVSFAQVYGYDPARKVHFTSYFASNGALGTATWEWSGTNVKEDGTEVAPNGAKTPYRCLWGTSDGRSMEGTCEYQTDGKWWVFRRFKGTKQ